MRNRRKTLLRDHSVLEVTLKACPRHYSVSVIPETLTVRGPKRPPTSNLEWGERVWTGGYPIQSWTGVPHLILDRGYSGYPQTRPGMGSLPTRPGMGYPPHPDLGWGTLPHLDLGCGTPLPPGPRMGYPSTPHPDLRWGIPHPDLRWSTPPPRKLNRHTPVKT